jgi:Raf kinase inhibitor-like YbhB/YbcL family protein
MAETTTATLKVTSPSFMDEADIPSKYTCEGDQISPALVIDRIPEGTETLAIIMEDPDTSKGTFDHWLVWNIPPGNVSENYLEGTSGLNGAGKTGYHGPCPPTGSHRYFFYVYALDTTLHLQAGSDKKALQEEIDKHLLAKGSIMGRYEKRKK